MKSFLSFMPPTLNQPKNLIKWKSCLFTPIHNRNVTKIKETCYDPFRFASILINSEIWCGLDVSFGYRYNGHRYPNHANQNQNVNSKCQSMCQYNLQSDPFDLLQTVKTSFLIFTPPRSTHKFHQHQASVKNYKTII